MKHMLLAVLTAAALPAASLAQDAALTVADGYARSANPKAAAGFMTIRNTGIADCTLTATSDFDLHTRLRSRVFKLVLEFRLDIEVARLALVGHDNIARPKRRLTLRARLAQEA